MSTDTAVAILYIVAGSLVVLAIHFLPTWFAGRRNAEHYWWIFAANLFLGWTIIGWVAVLIWALNARSRQPQPASIGFFPGDRRTGIVAMNGMVE
jgi:hypothetical protein